MGQKVETPAGVIDGVNDSFTTSSSYAPGSLSVWLNGQQVFGCYAETSPSLGTFQITDALKIPRIGDSLVADYDDQLDGFVVVSEIEVSIDDTAFGVSAALDNDGTLVAVALEDAPPIVEATITESVGVLAALDETPTEVVAVLQE